MTSMTPPLQTVECVVDPPPPFDKDARESYRKHHNLKLLSPMKIILLLLIIVVDRTVEFFARPPKAILTSAATGDLTFPGRAQDGAFYPYSGSVGHFYLMAQDHGVNDGGKSKIKMFDLQGNKKGDFDASWAIQGCIYSNSFLYINGYQGRVTLKQLQENSGQFVESRSESSTYGEDRTTIYPKPNSNFYILVTEPKLYLYDRTGTTWFGTPTFFDRQKLVYAPEEHRRSTYLRGLESYQLLMLSHPYGRLYFIKMSDLSSQRITNPTTGTQFTYTQCHPNENTNTVVYTWADEVSFYQLSDFVTISALDNAVRLQTRSINRNYWGNMPIKQLADMHPFNYLVFFPYHPVSGVNNPVSVSFIQKVAPFELITQTFRGGYFSMAVAQSDSGIIAGFDIVYSPTIATRANFGIINEVMNNFHTYYLELVHCLTRDPSTQVCSVCSPEGYLKNSLANNECIFKEDSPDGFGVKTGQVLLEPCAAANCKVCRDNYQICQECNPGKYLTSLTAGNQCVDISQIPDGLGIKTGDPVLQPCTSGCIQCRDAYQTCKSCTTGQYLNSSDSGNICLASTPVPIGLGINSTSPVLAPCSIHCKYCWSDFEICTECESGFFMTGTGTGNECVDAAHIPAGKGKKEGTNLLQPCTPGCTDCKADYKTCVTCESGKYLTNTSSENQCVDDANIPSGFGKKSGETTLLPCTAGCTDCAADYLTCVTCTSGKIPSNSDPGNECVDDPNPSGDPGTPTPIPAGFGKDPQDNSIHPCTSNCLKCAPDYRICLECESAHFLTGGDSGNKCVTDSNIPDGLGKRSGSTLLQPCALGCLKCSADYLSCEQCQETMLLRPSTLDPSKNLCLLAPVQLSLRCSEPLNIPALKVLIQFSSPICDLTVDYFRKNPPISLIRLEDSLPVSTKYLDTNCLSGNLAEVSFSSDELKNNPDMKIGQYSVVFKNPGETISATDPESSEIISFQMQESQCTFLWDPKKTLMERFREEEQAQNGFTVAVGRAMSYPKAFMAPLLMARPPLTQGQILDELFGKMYFLRHLSGPMVIRPEAYLKVLSMPKKVKNLVPGVREISEMESQLPEKCSLPLVLIRQELECSILSNGSFYFMQQLYWLVLNVGLSILHRQLTKRFPDPKKHKLLKFVLPLIRAFTMKYSVARMQGSQLIFLTQAFSGLRFSFKTSNGFLFFNLFVCLVLISYYVFSGLMLSLAGLRVMWICKTGCYTGKKGVLKIKKLEEDFIRYKQKRSSKQLAKRKRDLSGKLDLPGVKLFQMVFEGSSLVKTKFWAFLPLFTLIKHFLMALIGTMAITNSQAQISGIFVVELLYLGILGAILYKVLTYHRYHRVYIFHLFNFGQQIANLVYYSLKARTLKSDILEETRQESLGTSMKLTLLAMVYMCSVYAIYCIIYLIYDIYCFFVKKIKNKNKPVSTVSSSRRALVKPLKLTNTLKIAHSFKKTKLQKNPLDSQEAILKKQTPNVTGTSPNKIQVNFFKNPGSFREKAEAPPGFQKYAINGQFQPRSVRAKIIPSKAKQRLSSRRCVEDMGNLLYSGRISPVERPKSNLPFTSKPAVKRLSLSKLKAPEKQ